MIPNLFFNTSHLNEHNEEEYAARDVDLLPEEHHGDAPELPHEVEDDEDGGEEPAAAPAVTDAMTVSQRGMVPLGKINYSRKK